MAYDKDEDADDDFAEGDSADTDPCPVCGKPIYEEAQRCPHCGNYITREEPHGRQPLWIIVGTIALLAAIIVGWVILGR
jgi:predicted nucleic acid-binding Zn ribbon protein